MENARREGGGWATRILNKPSGVSRWDLRNSLRASDQERRRGETKGGRSKEGIVGKRKEVKFEKQVRIERG